MSERRRRSGLISRFRRNPRIVLRVLAFAGCFAGFAVLVLWMMRTESVMTGLQQGIAYVTSGLLNLLGQETFVTGQTVASSRFAVQIVSACTGLFMTSVFLSAVLVYPARLMAKLIGFAIGVGGILALNILRLVSLFLIGVYVPGFVDQAHLLIWQSLLILCGLFLWLLWAGKVAHAPHKA